MMLRSLWADHCRLRWCGQKRGERRILNTGSWHPLKHHQKARGAARGWMTASSIRLLILVWYTAGMLDSSLLGDAWILLGEWITSWVQQSAASRFIQQHGAHMQAKCAAESSVTLSPCQRHCLLTTNHTLVWQSDWNENNTGDSHGLKAPWLLPDYQILAWETYCW